MNRLGSTLYAALTALGLVGVATPFLPFADNISPLQAVDGVVARSLSVDYFSLFCLGIPFFLAIPVSIASARLVISGKISRTELVIAYSSSILMACAALFPAIGVIVSKSGEPTDWYASAAGLATIAAGSALIVRNWRKRVPPALIGVTAMQIAYVANALLCLAAFWSEGWQIGAIVALVTVAVYLAQVLFVVLRGEFRGPAADISLRFPHPA